MNHNFSEHQTELINTNPEFKEIIDAVSNDYSLLLRKMTHEFGNALTLINSSLQIIESSHPEVKSYKYWPSTISDVHYLINLISEVSFYNNSNLLKLSPVSIPDMINGILESYKVHTKYKNIHFNFSTPSSFPLITGDETKLKQVLINLIKNACESFTEESINKSVIILLRYDSDSVTIEISDNGCGITSAQLKDIFLPMISYKTNGTGLGLPISKSIIESHNGTISVSSHFGEGTKFIITLPH